MMTVLRHLMSETLKPVSFSPCFTILLLKFLLEIYLPIVGNKHISISITFTVLYVGFYFTFLSLNLHSKWAFRGNASACSLLFRSLFVLFRYCYLAHIALLSKTYFTVLQGKCKEIPLLKDFCPKYLISPLLSFKSDLPDPLFTVWWTSPAHCT